MVTQNAPDKIRAQPTTDAGRPRLQEKAPTSGYDATVFGKALLASLIGLAVARAITQAGWV